jgi:hypothetical protein
MLLQQKTTPAAATLEKRTVGSACAAVLVLAMKCNAVPHHAKIHQIIIPLYRE